MTTRPAPKLLITGINGLIGGIISAPLQKQYDVYGLDTCGPFSERVFEATIADYNRLETVLQKIGGVQAIVHLAADARVEAAWEAVLSANIIGTRNIYEAARAFNIRRVVFASSNHVTGAYEGFEPNMHPPLDEAECLTIQHPIRPDSNYGASKAFGETIARYYYDRWGIESICLRIGAVYRTDNPLGDPRDVKIWLSHRDLIELIEKSLAAPVAFGIYYGVSDNSGSFLDISNARAELGYRPVDDSANLGRA